MFFPKSTTAPSLATKLSSVAYMLVLCLHGQTSQVTAFSATNSVVLSNKVSCTFMLQQRHFHSGCWWTTRASCTPLLMSRLRSSLDDDDEVFGSGEDAEIDAGDVNVEADLPVINGRMSSGSDLASMRNLDNGVIMPEGGLGSPCIIKVRCIVHFFVFGIHWCSITLF